MERTVKSLNLGPSADLVILAPWRPGIIEADEAILPMARHATTFRALFTLRKAARELTAVPMFADPMERFEQIHSFRFAASPEGLRLAVTYDAGFEGYMRALWEPAGPFLDLLCCHCAGYPLARDTPLAEWARWLDERQVRSDYFYSASPLTVIDLAALTQSERIQREERDPARGDLALAGFSGESAASITRRNRAAHPEVAAAQAIRIIVALHRLTRYYTADIARSGLAADAATLVRVSQGLLEGQFVDEHFLPPWKSVWRPNLTGTGKSSGPADRSGPPLRSKIAPTSSAAS